MKKYISLFLIIFLVSCKAKVVAVAETKVTKDTIMTAEKVIENHYQNKNDFSTLYIKANAKYQDDKQSQNVTAEIKIKKDDKILISVRVLGITMAKALITPTSVQYYEKIGNKYFEGDYAGLSKWIGTDLDFNKVQNIFLGKALDDLHKAQYQVSISDNWYKLENNSDSITKKAFFFEGNKFLIKKQLVTQPSLERTLQIQYPDYKKYDEMILPLSFIIDAFQKEAQTNINIDYKNVTFNEDLSFPYSVPEGYERIFIE